MGRDMEMTVYVKISYTKNIEEQHFADGFSVTPEGTLWLYKDGETVAVFANGYWASANLRGSLV